MNQVTALVFVSCAALTILHLSGSVLANVEHAVPAVEYVTPTSCETGIPGAARADAERRLSGYANPDLG
jgi:hypothetical protein